MLADEQEIREATVTQLNDGLSGFIERAEKGERIVVTRHRRPVALIVSVDDGIDLLLAGSQRFALMRREAREQLEAGLAEELPPWR